MADIPYVNKGDQPSASYFNKVIAELRRMAKWHVGDGLEFRTGPNGQTLNLVNGSERRLGLIVGSGSCSGDDPVPAPNDQRYWVERCYVDNDENDDCDGKVTFTRYEDDDPYFESVSVTNLAEVINGKHALAVGTPVIYWSEPDLGDPVATRYYIDHSDTVGSAQYQRQVYQAVAQNVMGFDFVTAHAMLSP